LSIWFGALTTIHNCPIGTAVYNLPASFWICIVGVLQVLLLEFQQILASLWFLSPSWHSSNYVSHFPLRFSVSQFVEEWGGYRMIDYVYLWYVYIR
jgi:hypothetical protein